MQDLKAILDEMEIPVAYSHFNTTISPPVIAYYRDSTSNFAADGKVYKKLNNYIVELYTKYKDPELENKLEAIFDTHEIYYNVASEDYIDSEQLYQIIYNINYDEVNKDIITEASINIQAEGNIL